MALTDIELKTSASDVCFNKKAQHLEKKKIKKYITSYDHLESEVLSWVVPIIPEVQSGIVLRNYSLTSSKGTFELSSVLLSLHKI